MHGNKGRELYCVSADPHALGKTADPPPAAHRFVSCIFKPQSHWLIHCGIASSFIFTWKPIQVPKSTRDLQSIMGLRKHKLCKIIICCTPTTLYPTPFSLLLMNVKIKYQSKVNSISCHSHHLFIISGSSFRHQDLMFTFFPICFQIEKLGTHKELELAAMCFNTLYSLHTLVLSCKHERNSHTFDLWIQYNSFLSIFWAFFAFIW